jgi:hypothetical protein
MKNLGLICLLFPVVILGVFFASLELRPAYNHALERLTKWIL